MAIASVHSGLNPHLFGTYTKKEIITLNYFPGILEEQTHYDDKLLVNYLKTVLLAEV